MARAAFKYPQTPPAPLELKLLPPGVGSRLVLTATNRPITGLCSSSLSAPIRRVEGSNYDHRIQEKTEGTLFPLTAYRQLKG